MKRIGFIASAALLTTLSSAQAAVISKVSGSILSVTGTDSADDVSIVQDDDNDVLTVYDTATPITTVPSHQIKKIYVNLQDGDDAFFYGTPNGAKRVDFDKKVKIDLGAGNDDALIDFRGGGIGGKVVIFAKLDIQVKAGDGDDELVTHFNQMQGAAVSLSADMGNGDDTFFGGIWGDLSQGANVKFDVRGNKGYDSLSMWNTFDNSAYSYDSIDINNSTLDIHLDGGDQDDQLSVLQSGQINSRYKLRIDAGTGADTAGAYIALQPGSVGNVQAQVKGQGGDDNLDLEIVDNSGGFISSLKGTIDGSGGTDTCTATPNVTKLSCEL